MLNLHHSCILNFDMGRSAAPESGDKTRIVGARAGKNEPASRAVVAKLAVVRGEDAREQPLPAVVDPDGKLGARISHPMGLDAKVLGAEREGHMRSRGIARHQLRRLPCFDARWRKRRRAQRKTQLR